MRVSLSLVVSLVLAVSSVWASDRPSRLRTGIRFGSPILLVSNEPQEDDSIQTEPDPIDPLQPLTLNVSRCERECSPGMDVPKLHFGSRPIRVIGHLMAAPEDTSSGGGSSSRISPVHPDEIQFHFSALADLLATSGLMNESRLILEIQDSFQTDNYQRLLLAYKESQLRVLQDEIASLKKSLNAVGENESLDLTNQPAPSSTNRLPRISSRPTREKSVVPTY